jgi:hypothetical protein
MRPADCVQEEPIAALIGHQGVRPFRAEQFVEPIVEVAATGFRCGHVVSMWDIEAPDKRVNTECRTSHIRDVMH